MKNVTKHVFRGAAIGIVFTIIFGFFGCSPNSDDILRKYKGHHEVDILEDRLGIQFFQEETNWHNMLFFFSNTSEYLANGMENFKEVKENMGNILSNRFIVLNAENPAEPIEFSAKVTDGYRNIRLGMRGERFSKMEDNFAVEVQLYLYRKDKLDRKDNLDRKDKLKLDKRDKSLPKFILVGFKGIRESESEKWKTPALFYLLKNGEEGFQLLTSRPLSANNLFTADNLNAQFVEAKALIPKIKRKYEDKIVLGGGETLTLSFELVTKGEKSNIEKCEIAVETHKKNADGSNSVIGNKYNGYNIKIESDGKFSQTISDFFVSGKIEVDCITGSIKKGSSNYRYRAK